MRPDTLPDQFAAGAAVFAETVTDADDVVTVKDLRIFPRQGPLVHLAT